MYASHIFANIALIRVVHFVVPNESSNLCIQRNSNYTLNNLLCEFSPVASAMCGTEGRFRSHLQKKSNELFSLSHLGNRFLFISMTQLIYPYVSLRLRPKSHYHSIMAANQLKRFKMYINQYFFFLC